MYLLFESTIDKLRATCISNFTQDKLEDRLNNGDYHMSVSQAIYHKKDNFLEVTFTVNATNGGKPYTCILRFYKVGDLVTEDLDKARFSVVEKILRKIIKKCDVRFYSNDPSFYWQGSWEGLDKNDLSIYKFNGAKGDGVWDNRHASSGGLANSEIHLTKHLAQIVRTIDGYISQIAQVLTVAD